MKINNYNTQMRRTNCLNLYKNASKYLSFKGENKLCQDVFNGATIKPEVSQKLFEISDEFKRFLFKPLKEEDIVIVGSMASYNYRPTSDVDLHLVFDYTKIPESNCKQLWYDYFHKAAGVFSATHHQEINGHPIAVYADDITKQRSSGVYSIVKNKWLKQPNQFTPEIDLSLVDKHPLFKYFKENIINAIENRDKMKIAGIFKKLYDMRLDALNNKGENSVENLVFKALRNDKSNLYKKSLRILQDLDD